MGFRSDLLIFFFLSQNSMKFLCANRIASDETPHSAASHLGLFCLPMYHKKNVSLKKLKYRDLKKNENN